MSFDMNGHSDEYEERRKRRIDDSEERGERRTKRNRREIGIRPLLKLLVPDYVAGALIGKGGTVLKEMTKRHGGFLRLSSGREYYPGTEERIIVITGQVNEVIDLNNHIMEKVQDPGRDSTMKSIDIDQQRAQMVKIVLTDRAASNLIGKGGLTIKSIQGESKAKVSVAMPDKVMVPGERLLTIRGSLDERTLACKMVIEKVASDRSNMANTETKYVHSPPSRAAGLDVIPLAYDVLNALDKFDAPSRHYDAPSRRYDDPPSRRYDDPPSRRYDDPPSPRGNYNRLREIKLPVTVTAEVNVPVRMVGAILGKQGNVVKDIVRRSAGARLKFEDQKEGGEGETQKLTITGSMEQAQLAYALVNERASLYEQNTPMR